MNRVLLFGTSYVETVEMRDLVKLWAETVTKLNADVDILLIDSASPFNPENFLKHFPQVKINRFSDNIGHLSRHGKDGWGRAFCEGLRYAINCDYEYVAYIDSDIISTFSVMPVFERMAKADVMAACPMELTYHFVENGLCFLNVDYIESIDFIGQYDWENSTLAEVPERKFERILGDDLWILPMRGLRNDFGFITLENIDDRMSFGTDFLTHCGDHRLYRHILKTKGIA